MFLLLVKSGHNIKVFGLECATSLAASLQWTSFERSLFPAKSAKDTLSSQSVTPSFAPFARPLRPLREILI